MTGKVRDNGNEVAIALDFGKKLKNVSSVHTYSTKEIQANLLFVLLIGMLPASQVTI